ncbi:MAG: hypothetical protein U9N81_06360 [Bacillota bacterium]|nr:hypothetical protein [Bacillota bacterium]
MITETEEVSSTVVEYFLPYTVEEASASGTSIMLRRINHLWNLLGAKLVPG